MKLNKLLKFVFASSMILGLCACNNEPIVGPTGPAGPQGEVGEKGEPGKDGLTPHIGENGNWFVGDTDLGVKAQGDKGESGSDAVAPHIGENGNWFLGDTDLEVPATGPKGDKGEPGADGTDGKDGVDGTNGTNGQDGNDGADGLIPYIKDGNWWIGDKDTGVPATGPKGDKGDQGDGGKDGQDGLTPHIGKNGNWFVGDTDLEVPARGEKGDTGAAGANGTNGTNGQDGQDGLTPHIGGNGNWFIGDKDLGVKAQGDKGEAGKDGTNGSDGLTPHIGGNGNWFIGDKDLGVKAQGDKGKDGKDGQDGAKGEQGAKGETGTPGTNGKDAFDYYKESFGYEGTKENWVYDMAIGHVGTKKTHNISYEKIAYYNVKTNNINSIDDIVPVYEKILASDQVLKNGQQISLPEEVSTYVTTNKIDLYQDIDTNLDVTLDSNARAYKDQRLLLMNKALGDLIGYASVVGEYDTKALPLNTDIKVNVKNYSIYYRSNVSIVLDTITLKALEEVPGVSITDNYDGSFVIRSSVPTTITLVSSAINATTTRSVVTFK